MNPAPDYSAAYASLGNALQSAHRLGEAPREEPRWLRRCKDWQQALITRLAPRAFSNPRTRSHRGSARRTPRGTRSGRPAWSKPTSA